MKSFSSLDLVTGFCAQKPVNLRLASYCPLSMAALTSDLGLLRICFIFVYIDVQVMSEARGTGAGVTGGCMILALYWSVGNPAPS